MVLDYRLLAGHAQCDQSDLDPLHEHPAMLAVRLRLQMNLHPNIGALVGELIVEHDIDLSGPMKSKELTVEALSLGARRNFIKEVLPEHVFRGPVGDEAFGPVVLYDLSVSVEHDCPERKVFGSLRFTSQDVVEILATKGDDFHRRFLVFDGRT